tara:strand:- start:1615 stop:2799 length:1185 start_codon:yes stop_codon:yes gene_type:complete
MSDPNVPFELIVGPGIAEDPDSCTLVIYEGALEGTTENCRGANGESHKMELNGYAMHISMEVQNDGSRCQIITTSFGSSLEFGCAEDGSESIEGIMSDGTLLSGASSSGCTRIAAVDDSDYWFEFCRDGFAGTMRDGTEWEVRGLSGGRSGFFIAGVLSEVIDYKRPSLESMDEFSASPAMCSTILGEGYPPIAVMCRALEVVPAYSTEFVPSQEALDAAAAEEEARLALEAAAQAEIVAAAEQAAAAQAAIDQAAAEAAAAQAAIDQAAAEQALADAAAQAILDAGLVSTGYTAEEFASISAAAESLGVSLSEFQATGVHIIDFLTQLAGGYEIVVPLTDPPDANGPESVTSTWDEQARDVIGRVSTGYGATEAEAQKFGAFLLTFFVALSGG